MLNSTSERVLAIAAGGTFAIGGLITILGFEVFTPRAWTPMTVTTILLVAGTIFAGHLLSNAFADKRWLHGLGFSLVFAVGTCAVVLNSVGRQAETTQTKTLSADKGAVRDVTQIQRRKIELEQIQEKFGQLGAKVTQNVCGRCFRII
jgi:hypothetical protein